MSDHTKIQWTESTWNCIRGCSRVSRGCDSRDGGGCYAERMAHRFSGPGQPYEGLTRLTKDGPRWTGKVRLVPEALDLPLHWQKPRRVFVNSMSDLFHPDVPDEFIAAVFGVMAATPRHTYQVLTKRPERMRKWFGWVETMAERAAVMFPQDSSSWRRSHILRSAGLRAGVQARTPTGDLEALGWPLPNVWMGVSAEDQRAAETRVPVLLATPATLRFASCEPLLGPVDLCGLAPTGDCSEVRADVLRGRVFIDGLNEPRVTKSLDWIIAGGESGPGARPCDLAWIRSLVEQCKAAGTKCFVKQVGPNPYERRETPSGEGWDPSDLLAGNARDDAAHRKWFKEWTLIKISEGSAFYRYLKLRDRKGGDPAEFPEDLRIREMPEVRR